MAKFRGNDSIRIGSSVYEQALLPWSRLPEKSLSLSSPTRFLRAASFIWPDFLTSKDPLPLGSLSKPLGMVLKCG